MIALWGRCNNGPFRTVRIAYRRQVVGSDNNSGDNICISETSVVTSFIAS